MLAVFNKVLGAAFTSSIAAWAPDCKCSPHVWLTLATVLPWPQNVLNFNLVREYYKYLDPTPAPKGAWNSSSRDVGPEPPVSQTPSPAILTDEMRKYWSYLAESTNVSSTQTTDGSAVGAAVSSQDVLDAETRVKEQLEAERAEAATAKRGWPLLSPDRVHAAMLSGAAAIVDVRRCIMQCLHICDLPAGMLTGLQVRSHYAH